MTPYFRSFHGPTDWGWVQSHQRLRRVEDTSGIVAIDLDTERTVAAVLFDHWTFNGVNVHIVIENSSILRHGFLEEVADYVFNHCRKKVMLGFVPSDHRSVLELAKHIGFAEVGTVPEAFADGVDLVMFSLTPEQCRYYAPEPESVEETVDGQP